MGERITTEQAAAILGCSATNVVWHAEKGRLRVERDTRGARVFDREQVEAFAKVYKPKRTNPAAQMRTNTSSARFVQGRAAARVFKLLAEGQSLQDIVIQTETEPAFVRKCWEEYRLGFEEGAMEKRRQLEETQIARELEKQRVDDRHRQREEAALERAKLYSKRPIYILTPEESRVVAEERRKRGVAEERRKREP